MEMDRAVRCGGEEFAVLMPFATGEDGAKTAERNSKKSQKRGVLSLSR
jgi:GGDEF domain-containing protein